MSKRPKWRKLIQRGIYEVVSGGYKGQFMNVPNSNCIEQKPTYHATLEEALERQKWCDANLIDKKDDRHGQEALNEIHKRYGLNTNGLPYYLKDSGSGKTKRYAGDLLGKSVRMELSPGKRFRYLRYHITWALAHNELGDFVLDHINGDNNDDRLSNLRKTDATGNNHNLKCHREATKELRETEKGYQLVDRGISFRRARHGKGKYEVKPTSNCIDQSRMYYDTFEEALERRNWCDTNLIDAKDDKYGQEALNEIHKLYGLNANGLPYYRKVGGRGKSKHYAGDLLGKSAGIKLSSGKVFLYSRHQISWALAHNELGDFYLDHINGDNNDDRLSNLRKTDAIGNSRNLKCHREAKIKCIIENAIVSGKLTDEDEKYLVNATDEETKLITNGLSELSLEELNALILKALDENELTIQEKIQIISASKTNENAKKIVKLWGSKP